MVAIQVLLLPVISEQLRSVVWSRVECLALNLGLWSMCAKCMYVSM